MKLLHLLPDEKFTPFILDFCRKAYKGQNRFRIHSENPDNPTFAKEGENCRIEAGYYADRTEFEMDCNWSDIIVVNGLSAVTAKLFEKYNASSPIVWLGWGADYYNLLPDVDLKYGMPASRALYSNSFWVRKLPILVENPISRILKKAVQGPMPPQWAREFLPKVDYFSVIPLDWYGLEKAFPGFRPKHIDYFPYYTVEHSFAPGPDRMEGPDILVGNSATSTNNHVETLRIVHSVDNQKGRILAPLSYGRKHYADEITNLGRDLFGDRFTPLVDFLPVEEYNNLIASCGCVVLGHQRGQAMGNITAALYKGAKVFVRPENPYYSFYKDRGTIIMSLSSKQDLAGFGLALSESDKECNREIVEKMWSFKNAALQANKILEYALEDHSRKSVG